MIDFSKVIIIVIIFNYSIEAFADKKIKSSSVKGILYGAGVPEKYLEGSKTKVTIPFEVSGGYEAKQVCGYTDFSSLVVDLPSELLSLNYWKGFFNNALTQVLKAIFAVSAALPHALMCNISPTFCSILGAAEGKATFAGEFAFDACELMDSGLNQLNLNQDLHDCFQETKEANKEWSSSKIRDKCITSEKGNLIASGVDWIGDKAKGFLGSIIEDKPDGKKEAEPGGIFNMTCNTKTKKVDSSGGKTKTQIKKDCEFMKKTLFPGVTLTGGASVQVRGTFLSPFAGAKASYAANARDEIWAVLDYMHNLRWEKSMPPEKILVDSEVFAIMGVKRTSSGTQYGRCKRTKKGNKEFIEIGKCASNLFENFCDSNDECDAEKLSPLLRIPPNFKKGDHATLIVTPSSLYEMIALTPANISPSKYAEQNQTYKNLVSPFIEHSAHAKASAKLSRLRAMVVSECKSNVDIKNNKNSTDECKTAIDEFDTYRISLDEDHKISIDNIAQQSIFLRNIGVYKSHIVNSRKGVEIERTTPSKISPPSDL